MNDSDKIGLVKISGILSNLKFTVFNFKNEWVLLEFETSADYLKDVCFYAGNCLISGNYSDFPCTNAHTQLLVCGYFQAFSEDLVIN